MSSEDAVAGPELGGDTAAGASGGFAVTFSAAAAAAAEAEASMPKAAVTDSMRTPFRQPPVVDTTRHSSA